MPNKKTKKFSQFVQENNIDRPVGLTNGMNAIDDNSGSGNAPADATYVIRTPSPDLPNAQVLDDLEPGMMSVDTDGNIKSHVIIGINGTNVINGDGSMDGPIYIDGGGGGSSTGVSAVINQPGHGFEGGEWLRVDENSGLYVEALANTDENAEVIGMVTENIDVNTFRIQQSGKIESFSAINALIPWLGIIAAGKVLFLSETNSGEVSLAEPSALDTVSRPCVVCDGDDSGWIIPYRGLLNNTDDGGGGSAPSNPNIIPVHQPGHGFVVEDILRVSGSGTFTKALANTKANAQAVGMVIEWVDADNFVLQTEGFTNVVSGKVAAGTYYLSSTVPGQMTLVEPGAGNYSKPIFVALTSGSGFILEQRQLQSPTDSNIENVNQPGHGFAVENVVRVLAADTYTLAQANSLNNARAVGIVTKIVDANNFVLQTEGIADIFAGKTPGQTYWLSASTPGLLTPVEPSAAGEVSKPMLMPINATRGYILEQRPMLQPNANGGGGGGGGGILVQQIWSRQTASQNTTSIASPVTPNITEGLEVFTMTITPTSALNYIVVDISAYITLVTAGTANLIFRTFRSDTGAFIGQMRGPFNGINDLPYGGRYSFLAGTVAPITLSFRLAKSIAGPATAWLNLVTAQNPPDTNIFVSEYTSP